MTQIHHPLQGKTFSLYRITGVHGSAELGTLFTAQHVHQDHPALVLRLNERRSPMTDAILKEVLLELSRAHDLGPPCGLVRTENLGPIEGKPGFACRVPVGYQPLRQYLHGGPRKPERALAIVLNLAKGLARAHERDLVHGDLRPENILLADADADWPLRGQALLLWHSLHRLRSVLVLNLRKSLPYRPRELFSAEGATLSADASADVFALGAILYEGLTGVHAFGGDQLDDTDEYILRRMEDPPPPLELSPGLSLTPAQAVALDAVLARACAPRREHRYPSMADFLEALHPIAAAFHLEAEGDRPVVAAWTRQGPPRPWSPLPEEGPGPAGVTSHSLPRPLDDLPAPPPTDPGGAAVPPPPTVELDAVLLGPGETAAPTDPGGALPNQGTDQGTVQAPEPVTFQAPPRSIDAPLHNQSTVQAPPRSIDAPLHNQGTVQAPARAVLVAPPSHVASATTYPHTHLIPRVPNSLGPLLLRALCAALLVSGLLFLLLRR